MIFLIQQHLSHLFTESDGQWWDASFMTSPQFWIRIPIWVFPDMKIWSSGTFARDSEVELCSVLAMYKLILAGLFPRVSSTLAKIASSLLMYNDTQPVSNQHSLQRYFLFVYVSYLINIPHEWHSLILLIDKNCGKATAMFIFAQYKKIDMSPKRQYRLHINRFQHWFTFVYILLFCTTSNLCIDYWIS